MMIGMILATYLIVGTGAYSAGAFDNFNTDAIITNTVVTETTNDVTSDEAGVNCIEEDEAKTVSESAKALMIQEAYSETA